MWGIKEWRLGREIGALLRCCWKTTHPPPLPLREGALPTLRPPVGGNEKVQAEGGSEQLGRYEKADRVMAYGLIFFYEEINYLDSKAEGDARRAKEGGEAPTKGRRERRLEQGERSETHARRGFRP